MTALFRVDRSSLCCAAALWLVWFSLPVVQVAAEELAKVSPVRELVTDAAKDQDDLCFWGHPTNPVQSTIIASDKSANFLFVYDLDGKVIQQITVTKPGNIDIRQRVKLDGKLTDVVVVNQRDDGFKLRVFRVDPESRQLLPLDTGNVTTGPNYGGCLYHSRSGKLYFLCTSSAGMVEQHELAGDGKGGISGTRVRSWPLGKCEGAVADDETGTFYIAEEARGIWKVGAEPDNQTPGELVAEVDERHGLTGDLEGMAIYRYGKEQACLLVSDQGSNRFVAFDLKPPHRRLGDFSVDGVRSTDGIDLLAMPLGSSFPEGIFACHTDVGRRAVQVSSLAAIRQLLKLHAPVVK